MNQFKLKRALDIAVEASKTRDEGKMREANAVVSSAKPGDMPGATLARYTRKILGNIIPDLTEEERLVFLLEVIAGMSDVAGVVRDHVLHMKALFTSIGFDASITEPEMVACLAKIHELGGVHEFLQWAWAQK